MSPVQIRIIKKVLLHLYKKFELFVFVIDQYSKITPNQIRIKMKIIIILAQILFCMNDFL